MPEKYEIRVKGHANSGYFTWCQNSTVMHTDNGETVLMVTVRDQAELHGLLAQIRDLSLPLHSLNKQSRDSTTNANL